MDQHTLSHASYRPATCLPPGPCQGSVGALDTPVCLCPTEILALPLSKHHPHFPPSLLLPLPLGGLAQQPLLLLGWGPAIKRSPRVLVMPRSPKASPAVAGWKQLPRKLPSCPTMSAWEKERDSPSCFQENPAASSPGEGLRDPPNHRGGRGRLLVGQEFLREGSCWASDPHPGAGTREGDWVLCAATCGFSPWPAHWLTHRQPPAQFPSEGPTGQWGQQGGGSPGYL